MKNAFILITPLLMIVLTSCFALGGSSGGELVGTAWTLDSYGGKSLIPDSAMTAIFDSQELSGSASCNHYFAEYKVKGGSMEVDGLGWTEMACLNPEGIMQQEQEIMRLLSEATAYEIQGTRLVIKTGSGMELVFYPLETRK